ncbi:MAG TPA: hypothetical protein VJ184_08885 [Chryseolinea sp.]|nr:hypothetical protein [Chryseolinea sp.]
MENKGEQSPAQEGNQPRRIGRRQFLTRAVPAAVLVTAAAIAIPPIAKELIFGGSKENAESPPTFEDVEKAVKHAYNQEVPDNVQKLLPACNEKDIPPEADYVRTVVFGCAQVGGAVKEVIIKTPEGEARNGFIRDLRIIEQYTNGKIDKFLKQGKLPDPDNIEGYRRQIKEDYFTIPIKE